MERTEGKALSKLDDVRIEYGRIINVYPERATVDFRSEMSEQYRYDIPYGLPYFEQIEGTGITFNPEVGTTVICCTTSDSRSFILAFIPTDEDGSFQGGRPTGVPGDISITGKDGNFVHIRRGGVIQIGAKPICQSVYLPVGNIIQHFSENFEIYTLAGELKLLVDRPEDSSEGKSKSSFNLKIKEFTNDPSEIVSLDIGASSNENIFTLVTRDKGGGTIKLNLTIDKSGNLKLTLSKDLNINIKGDLKTTIDGETKINSTGNLEITSKQELKLNSLTTTISSDTTTVVKSNGILDLKGSQIKMNNGVFPVLRLSPDMGAFLSALAGLVAAAGVPPPVLHMNSSILV